MKNLVNVADVKRLTTVGASADYEKLDKAIPDATLQHLRPLLGAKLLGLLLDFLGDAPEAPTLAGLAAPAATAAATAYATALGAWRTANGPSVLLDLWDELQPCLAQWVYVAAWPDLLVHVEAAGINIKTGNQNGTTSADAATLNQVHNAQREKAVFRSAELVRWLEADKVNYPAYGSTQPLATSAQPIDYFGGISL
ncbi:MAG: hypothetical protein ACRYFK_14310 [Janthinobacterium lividum]